MENAPTDAAGVVSAPQTEEKPNTNPDQPSAPASPDMHGFTDSDLASLRTWLDSNGGFDKVKSRLSNPQNYQQPAPQPEAQPQNPTSQTQVQPQVQQPAYRPPEGSISAQEFLAEQYFRSLAADPKYATISEQVQNGDVLKEMASFNIRPLNEDGSINDTMVRRFLDLKAQTVPAQPTSAEPNASNAPTVDYVQVEGDKIASADQAYAILQQDAQLKAMGMPGHPNIQMAEDYIRGTLNPGVPKAV